ncbi:GAF and ANTAR domain-containing protein [Nocardioides sp. SOB44]|uniref:GAF and ANTAR domain-containing protein n=1 Tax=Nocardioides cremeus TaxID=3058044 RepID=A0ABT8TPJ6_9ACTN|nr:GAF and ANTAR domain-containing protein [Nocardioides cremeus]MDO3394426.1 GAF and ANTAR domain-containing protein [Nocardioides cremeus]
MTPGGTLGPHTRETAYAALFARISEGLLGDPSTPLTFQRVVERAREVVPGCEGAGITLRGRGRSSESTVAATSELAQEADRLQYELDEGPCLDSARGSSDATTLVSGDLRHEERWPAWADSVTRLGVRSVLSIRLHTEVENIGALNLYSRTTKAFGDESVELAEIYAIHATSVLSQARLVTGLRTALESRHDIGVAQGVLAVTYDISYEQAFELLRRISNDTNTKLRDVARQVLSERGLPAALLH